VNYKQRKGRKILFIATSVLLLSVVGIFGFNDNNDAYAKKPQSVIDWSNGFPSGEHSTMNIHGKKADYNCDNSLQGVEPYGSSVFVPIEGESEIDIVSNKRSSVTHGYTIDPCAAPFGQEPVPDAALYQLPYGEHQVYWRILGKPNNGNGQNGNDGSSEVVIYPKLVDLCNFLPTEFADGSQVNSFDPDAQVPLVLSPFTNEKYVDSNGNGMLDVGESIYRDDTLDGGVNFVTPGDTLLANDNEHPVDGTIALEPFVIEKFADANGNGLLDKGETVYRDNGDGIVSAGDIRLAYASSQGLPADEGGDAINCEDETLVGLGLVTNNGAYKKTEEGLERFDSESTQKGKGKSKAVEITDLFKWSGVVCDASLDVADPIGELTPADFVLTDADFIDDAAFTAFLASLELCTYYTETWVFYIADIVIYGLDYVNNGSTLTQIRYYPTATTEFT